MSFNSATAGQAALAHAEKFLGFPYAWGGGNAQGPTKAINGPQVGFDCSGLELYSYACEGIDLPHSTYLTYLIKKVSGAWASGDLMFILGSDPGPHGEPGHTGMFKGIGHISGASQHIFTPDPHGQLVFLNAPYTGDPGGIRYDYFPQSLIVSHTRPALLLPNPLPAPAIPPAKGSPTATDIANAHLVGLPNPTEAQLAIQNGWALWYWSEGHKPHQWNPQVDSKPTGVPLYARIGYQQKRTTDLGHQ